MITRTSAAYTWDAVLAGASLVSRRAPRRPARPAYGSASGVRARAGAPRVPVTPRPGVSRVAEVPSWTPGAAPGLTGTQFAAPQAGPMPLNTRCVWVVP